MNPNKVCLAYNTLSSNLLVAIIKNASHKFQITPEANTKNLNKFALTLLNKILKKRQK